jgi:D-sedoheptulose 7-phosphate isomerase
LRAVFLDRDGVLNRAPVEHGRPYSPATVAEFEILPGVEEAVSRLRAAGFHLVVVTNQPEVARGRQPRQAVEDMHEVLRDRLGLTDIRVCYHDDNDECACRKPRPGMLLDAAREHQIDLAASVMVGDRWRDVGAGTNAGCRTVFIDRHYDERRPDRPDAVVSSLAEAAAWILAQAASDEPMTQGSFTRTYLADAARVAAALDVEAIEHMVAALVRVREGGGRLFFLGVGGSAANCSHAVNDFRKLAGFEAYTPADNVAELTARTNDEGWETVFESWLQVSRLGPADAVMVFSVGGGSVEKNVSPNLVKALTYAQTVGAAILGIVGRDGGFTRRVADVCILIPTVNVEVVTPHAEAFQAVVWHLLVSHPSIKQRGAKWESMR